MLLCCGRIVLLLKLCPSFPCLQVLVVIAVQTAMAYAVKDVPGRRCFWQSVLWHTTPEPVRCAAQALTWLLLACRL